MRQKTGCGVALAAAVLWIATLPAAADMPAGTISTFNKAVQTGDADVIVEAAKVLGAVAVAHPEDRQAPVAAFEAANQLCLRNACAEAVPMAGFLGGLDDAALPVSRAEVDVLAAFAGWSASAKDKAADSAFRTVLDAYAAAAPSLLTVAAFEAFYVAKAGTDAWEETAIRARLAASHLKPVRDLLPEHWATAELLSATSSFSQTKDFSAYDQVSDLGAWVRGKRRDTVFYERLRSIEYETIAWQSALEAYFRSFDNTTTSKVRSHGRTRYEKQIKAAEMRAEVIRNQFESSPSTEPPFCSGKIVSNATPTYPRTAARKGYVGAVLLGVDFEDGEVSNIEVLASVPDSFFEASSLDGMKTFSWQFDQVPEKPDCTRTKKTAMVYPFLYVLQ